MVYSAFKKIRKYGKFLKTRRNGSYKYLLMSDAVTGPILLNTVEEGVKSSDTYFVMYKNRGFVEDSKIMSFTIRTTDNFYIPLDRGTSIDYAVDIDWGDGEKSTIGNGVISESDLLHTYSKPGDYVITIFSESAVIPHICFGFYDGTKYGSRDKLISFNSSLIKFDDQTLFTFASGCKNLRSIPKNFLKYNPGVTDFRNAFYGCTSLTSVPNDFFKYSSSNVSLSNTFARCTNLEYISDSLLSNVVSSNCGYMFDGCVNLKTHINVNTFFNDNQRTSIYISKMFYNCKNTTGNALEFQERFGATYDSKEALYNCVKWEGYSEIDKTLIYGDYQIEDGKLLWANPNLYISDSGSQYIDTEISLGVNTGVLCKLHANDMSDSRWCGGSRYIIAKNTNRFPVRINSTWNDKYAEKVQYGTHTVKLDIFNNNYDMFVDDILQQQSTSGSDYTDDTSTFCLFRSHTDTRGALNGKIFYCKIYSNQILVRDLVPVPQGLQIGDFTVPSNGMFDIVEQKFYGNEGTGTFTYGSDN